MIELGGFRLDLIEDGRFELKATDFTGEKSGRKRPRILIGFNSLLIRGHGRTILVDPGTGDKLLGDRYRHYRLEWPRKLFGQLDSLGVSRVEVDTVILTHLHWDHCGASTSYDASGTLVPTFPRAKYYVQRKELEAARWSLLGGDDGYIADDFEPLSSLGVLHQLDGKAEISSGIRVELVGGHSSGLQVVYIGTEPGATAVYLTDLIPTPSQLPLTAGMSYDIDPAELRESKRRVLDKVMQEKMLLLFVHAPYSRAGYLTNTATGELHFNKLNI